MIWSAQFLWKKGLKEKKSVDSMPDIMRLPLSEVSNEVQNISDLKIPAVMLFGIPSQKDEKEHLHLPMTALYRKQFLK